MKTILFVRHGQSEAQVGMPSVGPGTTKLTELGREQARHVAADLSTRVKADLLISSSYKRALETAETIAEAIRMQRGDVTWGLPFPVQEFTYLNYEGLRDTTMAERTERAEAYWKRCDPKHVDGPGAESFMDLLNRVAITLIELRKSEQQTVIIASHGNFMRAVLWYVLHHGNLSHTSNMRRFYQFRAAVRMPNTGVMRLTSEGGFKPWYAGPISDDHMPYDLRTE